MFSMETSWRIPLFTALAPIAWGSSYYVTAHFLPPGPAAVRRRGPRAPRRPGDARVHPAPALRGLVVAGGRARAPERRRVLPADLPGRLPPPGRARRHPDRDRADRRHAHRVGADRGAAAPGLARRRRDRRRRRGAAGAARRRAAPTRSAWPPPSARSRLSSLGFVLAKRWQPPVDMLTFSAWQLVAGGLVLVPVAALVEGAPPDARRPRDRRLPLHLRVRHRAGLRRVVHRPAPDARRCGRPRRPAEPGRRASCSASRWPARCSGRRRRWAWCWCWWACCSDSRRCASWSVRRRAAARVRTLVLDGTSGARDESRRAVPAA